MSPRTVCPNCGNPLKPGAKACLECGSDENTGWKGTANSEHPDVAPLDQQDYDDLCEKEFSHNPIRRMIHSKSKWKSLIIGAILTILVILRIGRKI